MESLTIEILNPKVKKLLNDLADLNLISISKSKSDIDLLLKTLRSDDAPSLEEITEEVEAVRSLRYEKKHS